MSPQFALIGFSIFIFLIIYIDKKRDNNFKFSGWLIAIWILYSGSKGLGIFLNIETTIEAGSPPDRYFQIILGLLAILILIKRNFSFTAAIKQNVLYFFILSYFLFSVLWAQNQTISFKRWGRELIAAIIALLLVSEEYPLKTLIIAFRKAIYAALPISILLIKYFPVYGREYGRWSGELMWTGIASQKNGLAMLCAISILFLLWSIFHDVKNWRQLNFKLPVLIDVLMFFLALYLLLGPERTLGYSATSTLSLLVGLIILVLLKTLSTRGSDIKNKVIITAIIIIVIGILLPFSGKIPLKTLPGLFNRSATLTGRTEIWRAIVPYAKKNILFGHGYGGFWNTSLRSEIASHAHNGYLDTILELGLIGLSLFTFYIINLIKKTVRLLYERENTSSLFMALIFMILVRNIAESPLTEFTSYSMWLLLAWSFIVNQTKAKSSDNQIN